MLDIKVQIERILAHPLGAAGVLMEDELAAGRRLVQPGASQPFAFPEEDWHFPAVLSYGAVEARIVAVFAKRPGTGALHRLVGAIAGARLWPVIVCPLGVDMPAILKHWRWELRLVGPVGDRTEEWRPAGDLYGRDA